MAALIYAVSEMLASLLAAAITFVVILLVLVSGFWCIKESAPGFFGSDLSLRSIPGTKSMDRTC